MTDSYIDLTLEENDIKLKAVDNGDGTYSLAVSADIVVGDSIILGSPVDGVYIGDIKFGESLPAGEAHIGEVGCKSGLVSVTPVINRVVYTANDAVGSIQTLTNAARVSGKPTTLFSITITDLAIQSAAFSIYFFKIYHYLKTANLPIFSSLSLLNSSSITTLKT